MTGVWSRRPRPSSNSRIPPKRRLRWRRTSAPAAPVHRKALDLATRALRAERPLTGKALHVIGYGCVVTVQAPRELADADAWSLAHPLDNGSLQGAEGQVAPQGHVAVRVIPAVVAALLRMDESLLLQDLQVVRGDPVLKADGIPDLRERGPGMVSDALVHQEADFPLENVFSDEAGVLGGHAGRGRGRGDRAHPAWGGGGAGGRPRAFGGRAPMNWASRTVPR